MSNNRPNIKLSVSRSGGGKIKTIVNNVATYRGVMGYWVGWDKSSVYNDSSFGPRKIPIQTARVAKILEYGSPSTNPDVDINKSPMNKGIPARPFFKPANTKFRPVMIRMVTHLSRLNRSRKPNTANLHLIAQAHVEHVQAEITKHVVKGGNADFTIEKKGGDTPLLESGQLERDLNYEVKRMR